MSHWSILTKAALLGTQRAELPKITDDSEVVDLFAQLNTENQPHALLSMAGTLDLYLQIGQMPGSVLIETAVTPPPPENLPTCSHQSARRLLIMLDGNSRTVLPEFLTAINAVGQRIPATHLPQLLSHGSKYANMRPIILPVLGQTGRWLAAQNPKWAYAAPAINTWEGLRQQWDTTILTQRHSLLQQIRLLDPQTGRQLLESSWKSEIESTRTRLIKLLATNLSMADEPFLETALDDRNRIVRSNAADLLAKLPSSRYSQRMQKHIDGFLTWTPDHDNQISLKFKAISPQMMRDGIPNNPKTDLARLRGQQLIHMLTAVPLEHWTDIWPVPPETIVAAIPTTRWPRTLTIGFTKAAQKQKNVAWANALINGLGLGRFTNKLIVFLQPADINRLVAAETAVPLSHLPLSKESNLFNILRNWTHTWDDEMTRLWLTTFATHVTQDTETKMAYSLLRTAVTRLARTCPPETAVYAADILLPATQNQIWETTINETLRILTFRKDMLEEIQQPTLSPHAII